MQPQRKRRFVALVALLVLSATGCTLAEVGTVVTWFHRDHSGTAELVVNHHRYHSPAAFADPAVQYLPEPMLEALAAHVRSLPELPPLRDYARARVCAVWGCDQWPAFDELVQRESRWNPWAVNQSSGACGLGQQWPCRGLDDLSPYEQVEWVIAYVRARFGTPSGALAFHNRTGYY